MLTCLFKCQRFTSVSPPSKNEKEKKTNSKGPLPKWFSSRLFPCPLLTLAPQESASPPADVEELRPSAVGLRYNKTASVFFFPF